jgi:hypothetical protein
MEVSLSVDSGMRSHGRFRATARMAQAHNRLQTPLLTFEQYGRPEWIRTIDLFRVKVPMKWKRKELVGTRRHRN